MSQQTSFLNKSEPTCRQRKHEPTKAELRQALERLCQHLGEMPHDWPSRPLFLAYCDASNLLDPDEFRERFMSSSTLTERNV